MIVRRADDDGSRSDDPHLELEIINHMDVKKTCQYVGSILYKKIQLSYFLKLHEQLYNKIYILIYKQKSASGGPLLRMLLKKK